MDSSLARGLRRPRIVTVNRGRRKRTQNRGSLSIIAGLASVSSGVQQADP